MRTDGDVTLEVAWLPAGDAVVYMAGAEFALKAIPVAGGLARTIEPRVLSAPIALRLARAGSAQGRVLLRGPDTW